MHTPLDPSTAHEVDTLLYFSSSAPSSANDPRTPSTATDPHTPSIADDPRNHCVPLWDLLSVEVDGVPFNGVQISVMPLFRDWYAPRMVMVCEAMGFVRQMLEVSVVFFFGFGFGFGFGREGAGG